METDHPGRHHTWWDLKLSTDFGLDNMTQSTYLQGVAAMRAGLIPPSRIEHQQGSSWNLLGHLFDPELNLETGNRALFLLGAAAEGNEGDHTAVLRLLGNPYWAMGIGDKSVVLLLAASLRPAVAIDAGTFLGGSAQALAMFADRVITIDCDRDRADHVSHLANVEFRCGVAAEVLKEVLQQESAVELIVLDADHTTAGISAEVEQVLRFPPSQLRAVLIHDSALDTCRAGLDSVDWHSDPAIRGVTLDFLPGEVNEVGRMVGGMALVWSMAQPTHPEGSGQPQ